MKIFINLLPPSKKHALQTGMIMAYAQTMVSILFIIAVIVSGTMISMRLVLSGEREHLKTQAALATSSESTDIMTNIRQINSYLLTSESLQENFMPWADVLKDIASLVPLDTQIYRFRTDQANRIFIDGLAATRDGSLSLLKSLQEQPYLSDVKSPISNILQKTNVVFSFEMKYIVEDEEDQD